MLPGKAAVVVLAVAVLSRDISSADGGEHLRGIPGRAAAPPALHGGSFCSAQAAGVGPVLLFQGLWQALGMHGSYTRSYVVPLQEEWSV